MKNQTNYALQLNSKTVFLLLLSLLFSGCFNQKEYDTDKALEANRIEEVDGSANGEVPLEVVESTKELQDELDALSKSGKWETTSVGPTVHSREKIKHGVSVNSADYDFPVIATHQVNAYIELFQGRLHKTFAKQLERSGRYLPMLEKELTSRGLPKDLAYLAMVESGFNPLAKSPASAVGLWQFISSTGKSYNLRIDKYVDERRNAEKATKAAASFLGDLYRDFNDWHLAVAAYNGGPGRIHKGLKKHGVHSFWQLAETNFLPMETKRYVPKLIASIIIARNPEKYGFRNIRYSHPLQYDQLTVGSTMDLKAIALVTGRSVKEIRQLNPELRRQMTPAGQPQYRVKIPKGTAQLAQTNFNRLHRIATTAYKTHKVRRGENIFKICKRYGINATTLLKVNHLRNGRLQRGKRLRIPYNRIAYQLLPQGVSKQMVASKSDLILHKVKKGETIGKLAQKYHVSQSQIASWNGLKKKRQLKRGQHIALFMKEARSSSAVQIAAGNQKSTSKKRAVVHGKKGRNGVVQITSTRKKLRFDSVFPHKSRSKSQKRVQVAKSSTKHSKNSRTRYYNVRKGDSLWKIAKKFRISTASIKKWNGLKGNRLKPGNRLKIKTR